MNWFARRYFHLDSTLNGAKLIAKRTEASTQPRRDIVGVITDVICSNSANVVLHFDQLEMHLCNVVFEALQQRSTIPMVRF